MAAFPIAPAQRKWWALGVVAVAIATALAVWWGASATRGLSWQTVGYHPTGNRAVEVTFDVTGQRNRAAECDLRALDFDRNQVGVSTVQLPASKYDSTRYTRTIPTVTKAAMGEVLECRSH